YSPHTDLHSFPTRRSSDLPKKNKLLDETHSSLYGVITQLETDPVRDQQDFDDRHERWCLDRISFFKEHPHGDKNKKVDFTYGHRSEEHTSELQSRFDLVCR